MRPVEKTLPLDKFGQEKVLTEHACARGDLIDQIGEYCSYCGLGLGASLAVEHVRPKNSHPELALVWDNFILSCSNCNSTKGHKLIDLAAYYWPHLDNTHRVFAYGPGGTIGPHPDLNPDQRAIAQRTIKLTGLDKRPVNDPKRSDRRWMHRLATWRTAQAQQSALLEQDTLVLRDCIAALAKVEGFWSVWVSGFKDDSDMLQRFERDFSGTYAAYLHSDIRPRTPRQLGDSQ